MAKRLETRAAAAKSSARKPAPRAAASAAKTVKKATKATAAESLKTKTATAKKAAPAKSKTTKTSTPKPAKSAEAAALAAKSKASKTPRARALAKKLAAKAKSAPAKAKARSKARTSSAKASSKPKMPRFLAAELGHPVDHDGEPIGAGSRAALGDAELQRYTLQLWRQMQSRRGVNTHIPAMERAGVTIDQIWTAGVTDRLTTSSTPDEVKRYRQKLLFRANLLESILTETVDELQRLGTIDPTTPPAVGEPG